MANGEVLMTAAAKAALLVRLDPETLGGGKFSTPSQKSTELALILREVVDAVDDTGA